MKKLLFISIFVTVGIQESLYAGDSWVRHLKYEKIQEEMKSLAQNNSSVAEYIEYGTSVEGRRLSLIRLALTGVQRNFSIPAPAIQISGAIHGNEYLDIELPMIKTLTENYQNLKGVNQLLAQGGVIYFIPVVNPDGYARRSRENAHRVNLNRDFDSPIENTKSFHEPETRYLAEFLDSDLTKNQLQLKFSLDYHCCLGALLIPWSYKNLLPAEPDLSLYKQIVAVEKKTLGLKWGNPSQTVGYSADASSMDYFYSKYGTLAMGFEGRHGGEKPYLENHIQFIDGVLSDVILAKTPETVP